MNLESKFLFAIQKHTVCVFTQNILDRARLCRELISNILVRFPLTSIPSAYLQWELFDIQSHLYGKLRRKSKHIHIRGLSYSWTKFGCSDLCCLSSLVDNEIDVCVCVCVSTSKTTTTTLAEAMIIIEQTRIQQRWRVRWTHLVQLPSFLMNDHETFFLDCISSTEDDDDYVFRAGILPLILSVD